MASATVRKNKTNLTADQIVDLLAAKHGADLFVPQCKNGPTWNSNHLRLDAWAMKRSWTKPSTYGYEVKISRSDFLGDDKWHGYLECCSDFYFVAPEGVIDVAELPESVGLLTVASTGTRLFTKRKAHKRGVVIPEDFYRYILMCRVGQINDRAFEGVTATNLEYWRDWIHQKRETRELGRVVSKAIREHVCDCEKKVYLANGCVKRYDKLQLLLDQMGITKDNIFSYQSEDKIRHANSFLPAGFLRTVREAIQSLEALQEKAEKMLGGGE